MKGKTQVTARNVELGLPDWDWGVRAQRRSLRGRDFKVNTFKNLICLLRKIPLALVHNINWKWVKRWSWRPLTRKVMDEGWGCWFNQGSRQWGRREADRLGKYAIRSQQDTVTEWARWQKEEEESRRLRGFWLRWKVDSGTLHWERKLGTMSRLGSGEPVLEATDLDFPPFHTLYFRPVYLGSRCFHLICSSCRLRLLTAYPSFKTHFKYHPLLEAIRLPQLMWPLLPIVVIWPSLSWIPPVWRFCEDLPCLLL